MAGYRAIKESSEQEIIRLKEQVNTLSLDLLAEKQLRRIHQTTLSQLDPDNPDFKISEILNDESLKQRMETGDKSKHYSITPFWQLNCEVSNSGAPQKDAEKDKIKPYVIPSKIQRAEPAHSQSKLALVNKFRDHQYKKSVFQRDQPERPNQSSPSRAYNFSTGSQIQFGNQNSDSSRLPFKFGDQQPSSSSASNSTFSRESQNPQNGFQMLSSGQSGSPSSSFLNFGNSNRYRERITTSPPESPSSSSKITFPQKISDR